MVRRQSRQTAQRLSVLLVLLLLLSQAACTKNPLHPGAINAFDSNTYDVVLTYHDAIESVKADYASGAFPASSKDLLNKFIDAYNVLQGAYVTYHSSTSANPDQTAIAAAIASTAAAFADLVKAYPKAATPSTKPATAVSRNVVVTVGGVK